jgi:hypothetical protein
VCDSQYFRVHLEIILEIIERFWSLFYSGGFSTKFLARKMEGILQLRRIVICLLCNYE